jgi:phospholipase A-2-activating protein
MQSKIEQLNQALIKSGQKDISLNPTELSVLQNVRKHLDTSGATQTLQTVKGSLDLAVKLMTAWPYADRLPGLDLLRLLAVAPSTATYTHPRGGNIIDVLESSIHEKQPPAENHVMMAVRAFANLFESAEGRNLALREFTKVQEVVASSLAGATQNRNLLVAITTLYINYAVLFSSTGLETAEASSFDHAVPMLDLLGGILRAQSDSEVVFRALVATGTLAQCLGDEVRIAAKEVYDLPAAVQSAVSKAADPRVKNVGKEISALWAM